MLAMRSVLAGGPRSVLTEGLPRRARAVGVEGGEGSGELDTSMAFWPRGREKAVVVGSLPTLANRRQTANKDSLRFGGVDCGYVL